MAGYGYLISNTIRPYWKKVKADSLADLKGIPKKCVVCGTCEGLTIDHKLPKSTNPKARGYLANYQLMCYHHNQLKGNRK